LIYFPSRHRSSGATALAHIDQVDSDQLEDLVQQLCRVSDTLPQGLFDLKKFTDY
jgi:hypothetical protein